MITTNNLQQNIEKHAKAPAEIKQRTLKKIESMNVVLELAGFFYNVPKILLNEEKDNNIKNV